MNRNGSSTVRGRGGSGGGALASRTSIDQVFGYATVPRNYRGGSGGRSPVAASHFASVNGYGWTSGSGQGRGGSVSGGRGSQRGGSGQYNTYGRVEGQNAMGSFRNSGRVEVVDGLVMNRFQKPNGTYATGYGQGSVMNSGFYRSPGSVVSVPYSPTSPGVNNKSVSSTPSPSSGRGHKCRGGSVSRDESFEGDVDIPPYHHELEMSHNHSHGYSGGGSHYPPAIPENPPFSRKNPPDNKSSLLLSREENQVIFDILGKGRQVYQCQPF